MKLNELKRKALNENFPIIKKIAQMTDRNDHNGARILGAQMINDKKLLKLYTAIKDIADIEGRGNPYMLKYRDSLDQILWQKAKEKLDSNEYEAFHGAF